MADTVDKVTSSSCGGIWIAAGAKVFVSPYAGFGIDVGISFASGVLPPHCPLLPDL